MEQFFIDAVNALCKEFGYKLNKNTKGLSIELVSQHNQEITEAIEHLNKAAGAKYNISTKVHRDLLDSLFRSNYTVDDVKEVINLKVKEWGDDAKMRKYLRPSTLFNKSKFDRYVEEAQLDGGGVNMYDLLKGDWNE